MGERTQSAGFAPARAVKGRRTPWWRLIGPGIVSGASDNDPTTVATLAVIGSTMVYALGWLVLLVIPMLAVVQAISGRIGAVGGQGLETILRERYGRVTAIAALVAVLSVNQLTFAADAEGGAAALQLLVHVDYRWFLLPLCVGAGLAITVLDYGQAKRFLLWIPLLFLTYAAAAIVAHPHWRNVLLASFVPHVSFDKTFAAGAIALLGTTLTAYAYVWEEIEISEERPRLERLGLVQVDATLGTIVAGISFWFIVIATGATLGIHHHTVQTAQDAARALQPVAGRWASLLFGVGLLGSSLIALPVLAGTTAYMVAELFGYKRHTGVDFQATPLFRNTVAATVAIGAAIAFAGVHPIQLLFIASIAGGLATPITLLLVMLVAHNRRLMTSYRLHAALAIAGWAVFGIVSAAAIFYLITSFAAG